MGSGFLFFVSIPYRQSKNRGSVVSGRVGSQVSIPYRQSKNKSEHAEIYEKYLFQFLIGSLKTDEIGERFANITEVSIPYRQSKNSGQNGSIFQCVCVSIPYRQSKNVFVSSSSRIANLVSIPYRQSKNGGGHQVFTDVFEQFQFLIGSLKTTIYLFCYLLLFVSIPYRQSKNYITHLKYSF